jgi:hypothetical protein
VKGWESKLVGFGWSGPQLERAIPEHGRFLTHDRIGIHVDRSARGNPFAYVGSLPHALIDPFGLFTTVIIVTHDNPTPEL